MKMKIIITALIFTLNANASNLISTNSVTMQQSSESHGELYKYESGKVKYDLKVYELINKSNKISRVTFTTYYSSSPFLKKLSTKNKHKYRELKFTSSENETSFSLEKTPTSGFISSENNFVIKINKTNSDEYFYSFTETPTSSQQRNNYLKEPIRNFLVKTNKVKIHNGESIVIEVIENNVERIYVLTPCIII